MNLQEQLDAKRDESVASREQHQVDVMKRATEELIASGIEESSLSVGDEIPNFNLPNVSGQLVDINDLLSAGPLIITFYRGSWCPYCNLELRAYQNSLEKIEACGAQLLAISPELPDSSLARVEKQGLEFEVLSDVGNVVAREFGLVFTMPDDLVEVYKQLNSDITKNNGDNSWELPLPATYIVDSNKRIAFSYVNADYLQRVDPQLVISELEELAKEKV